MHLVECGLKKGIIKSIRGNRLHLFFQQSEIHSNYFDIFIKYLTTNCPKKIEYLDKLIHDYQLTTTQDQLKSVAIFSQLVSRPWMKRFYRGADTSYTHMEAFNQVSIFKPLHQRVVNCYNITLNISKTLFISSKNINTILWC